MAANNSSPALSNDTLVGLFVQTRHGLRFPYKKVFPGNQNWPVSSEFWSVMDGMLTPTGSAQMTKIGEILNKKYNLNETSSLLPTPDYHKWVYMQSTAKPRTVTSGMALLQGLLPSSLVRLHCPQDKQPDYSFSDASPSLPNNNQTVTIYIPHVDVKEDPFCNFQHKEEYVAMRDTVAKQGGRWGEWEKDERIPALLEKLWKMTGWDKMHPAVPLRIRLFFLYGIEENLELDLSLPMLPFRNPHHLSLSQEEQKLVETVSNYAWELRYCGHTQEEQHKIGKILAAEMGRELLRRLGGVVEGGEGERLFCYSSHDTAIAPLLSLLGMRGFPVPKVGCYLNFELHCVEKKYFVRTLINFDPVGSGEEEGEKGVKVMPPGEVERWGEGGEGVVSWEDFKKRIESYLE